MNFPNLMRATALAAATLCSLSAQAADWSDTYIGYRYGTDFREPNNAKEISKNILNFGHASGYKYGSNFLNADLLLSDENDPANGGKAGAQEIYVVYRNTLDMGKVTGKDFKFGPVRGVGAVVGFDFNTKSDGFYNSKKRMLVVGPSFMMDVPGFLNVGLFALWESNAPASLARYNYDVHPMLNLAWGVPVPGLPLSFEGFANFIASKGKNEFGVESASETNIDMQVMYDLSGVMGAKPKTFRVGLEYQWWKNKFGNNNDLNSSGGAFAKTTMIRAEYHF
jgi:nucleoside-specific outer membrane channel protein Tsx